MSKDYLPINAGRVILTKVDPLTGALSVKPEDKRILTEVCDGITKKKSLKTYEIADGNSNYPAGIYEEGADTLIDIGLNTLTTATLAFLQNAKIKNATGNMKELVETAIPMVAPFEIVTLGKIVGTPTVLDNASKPFTVSETEPTTNEFKVTAETAPAKDKIIFAEADAGKVVFIEYVFEAEEVEFFDEDENPINPVLQIEIIHETLSRDKLNKYKNNSIISRAQLTGDISESIKKQAGTTTLSFKAIKPAGTKVVMNRKTEIPLQ